MAESSKTPKATRRGGRYCAAGTPNQRSCKNTTFTPGIRMHEFPSDPSVRAQWVQFVRRHRHDYKDPTSKYASLCSAHFDESCYERKMSVVRSVKKEYKLEMRVFLKATAVPTRDSVTPQSPEKISQREKRKLTREVMAKVNVPPKKKKKKPSSSTAPATLEPASDGTTSLDQGAESEAVSKDMQMPTALPGPSTSGEDVINVPSTSASVTVPTIQEPEEPASDNSAAYGTTSSSMHTGTTSCKGCKHKAEYQKAMRAKKRLKSKVKGLKKEVCSLKATIAELQSVSFTQCVAENETEEEEGESAQPSSESTSHGQNYFSWSSTGEEEEDGAVEDSSDYHYNQPKFIVFYEMLLKIFLFCFNCKENNPQVSMVQNGTMVTVRQKCAKCIKGYVWTSQRMMPHGKYPAGNVLLSLAVLMAGASISKILLVFRHMGLVCYSARTFFKHQRSFLFPAVIHHWESYQTDLLNKVKDLKDVVWAGDGRYDSMGHSAKYGAYTLLCTTIMKIVHFELVQANETGGSYQTELEGVKRCFGFLQRLGVKIGVFISDRHRGYSQMD
ncbi:unnamed protein product [Porites lobata]|uniref:THAP-type domain-containing protein n=1 Tax=Porites lobata TaxID=104759 RepID=A0ABN8N897_9CNID|nr:unnamed protein product [Porites lobata]